MNITTPTELLCTISTTEVFPNCRRGIANPELDSLSATAQNYSNDNEFDGDYHTLKVQFDFLGHQVTSITGLRSTDESMAIDLDASNANFYHVNREQDYKQLSQEFTAQGEYSDALSYSFGAYLLNTDYEILQQEFHILQQLGDAGFSDGHAAGEIQELASSQDSSLYSAFAAATYILNDQWIAEAGLRWSVVDKDFNHSPSRIRLGNKISPLRTLIKGKDTTKETLVSAGISYKVDEKAMIYARYAEGFLPSGFDENAMSAFSAASYGAERSQSAEIGLKSDWWEDKLRVNLVFYEMELDHKVERFDTLTDTGSIESKLDNVAAVDVSGWEIEIETTPLKNLSVRAAFSHVNSNYNRYLTPDLNAAGSFIDLSSQQPNRAPDENLHLALAYKLSLGPGTLHSYAGYRLLGDYQTNSGIEEAEVHNWTTWDLSLSYEWQEWVFRLFSNNVNDKRYIQNISRTRQTDILPVNAGVTSVPSLNTFTEYNQPRYTGFEIIYRPTFVFGE